MLSCSCLEHSAGRSFWSFSALFLETRHKKPRVSVTSTRTPLRLRKKAMNASVSSVAKTPVIRRFRSAGVRDLDRLGRVAIVFGRNLLQLLIVKDNLADATKPSPRVASTAIGVSGHAPSSTRTCWSAFSSIDRGDRGWARCHRADGNPPLKPLLPPSIPRPGRTSNLVPRSVMSADPVCTRKARFGLVGDLKRRLART